MSSCGYGIIRRKSIQCRVTCRFCFVSRLQDMADTQEKLRLQSKELKDAIGQRKLAMTEYTEVSDK